MLFSFVVLVLSVGVIIVASQEEEAEAVRPDEELMLRYASGDLRAFEEIYQRHRKPVFNFIFRYVKSQEHAEELLQDVFLRLVQNAQNYEKQAKFTTWLYTIARNICIDTYRRKKHRQTVSMQQTLRGDPEEGLTFEQILEDPSQESLGEDRVYYHQLRQVVESGLANLPEEQREVFLLREVSQLPFKEIASIVGTLENTVKSRMRYALEYLRRHVEAAGFSLDDLK